MTLRVPLEQVVLAQLEVNMKISVTQKRTLIVSGEIEVLEHEKMNIPELEWKIRTGVITPSFTEMVSDRTEYILGS